MIFKDKILEKVIKDINILDVSLNVAKGKFIQEIKQLNDTFDALLDYLQVEARRQTNPITIVPVTYKVSKKKRN